MYSVSTRYGITETSEKMAEVNLLSDFVSLVRSLSGNTVTVVAPSPPEEERLAFDEIFEGLPPGRVLALQFKRPSERRDPLFVSFTMNVAQQVKLSSSFQRGEAYYMLVPYPLVSQFIANRGSLLDFSAAVDVQNIPNAGKVVQRTRTMRYEYLRAQPGSMSFRVRVTDPAPELDEAKTETARDLAKGLVQGKVGRFFRRHEAKEPKKSEGLGLRKVYFVHLAVENTS